MFEGNQHPTPTEYSGQNRALTFIRLHFKQLRDRKGKIGENQLAKMSETGAGRSVDWLHGGIFLVSVLRAVILGVYE